LNVMGSSDQLAVSGQRGAVAGSGMAADVTDVLEGGVTSVISARQISARKPDHNSIWLYVLITVFINTYYITFYITHSYR
jgi:hypothetical protein